MINIMHGLCNDPDVFPGKPPSPPEKRHHIEPKLNFHSAASLVTRVLSTKRTLLSHDEKLFIKKSEKYKTKVRELEEKSMRLEPKVEDRIVCIRDDKVI